MAEIMSVRTCAAVQHDIFDVQEILAVWKKIMYCVD